MQPLKCCKKESVDKAIAYISGYQPRPQVLPLQILPWWKQSELMMVKGEHHIGEYLSNADRMPPARHNFTGNDQEYQEYMNLCMIESKYLMSWRAKDAPLFTVFYRGSEMDALVSAFGDDDDHSDTKAVCKKTVFFSHDTGECYICASPHLQLGKLFLLCFNQYAQN